MNPDLPCFLSPSQKILLAVREMIEERKSDAFEDRCLASAVFAADPVDPVPEWDFAITI